MPGAAPNPIAQLIAIGVTPDSAGPDMRERIFSEEPDSARLLRRLRATPFDDVLALSTCERVEIFAISGLPGAEENLLKILARETGTEISALQGPALRRQGGQALAHLFAVAAGLESEVIGEPQILGQVKESHRQAAALGLVGPGLEPMLQAAYRTAKRVRSETGIGLQSVSIGASAVMVARDVHGDLARCGVLIAGLGEMSEFLAGELQAAGVRDITILHPTLARARGAALRLACHFRPWKELDQALAAADIVVGALGAGRFIITRLQAEAALHARRRVPMYFIDAAVPHDIEPAVNDLDGAFVYDMADLERIATRGRAARKGALAAARDIVRQDLEAFTHRSAARGAAPAVVALRHHFEAARLDVLAGGGIGAEEATRRLINRLLHDPTVVLKTEAVQSADTPGKLEATLRRLFRIGGGGTPRQPGPDPDKEDDT